MYIEALPGFSHICLPDGLEAPYSLKNTSLEQLLVWEWGVEFAFQGQGREGGASDWLGPAPVHDFLQTLI